MGNQTWRLALAAALLWIGFGVGGWAEAAGIALQTPAGLSPGDHFRFVFIADGVGTTATSSNIADYNSFVNTQAGGATYNGATITWDAIASTPTVNAIDNVGQTPDPVYQSNGTLITTSTTSTGLWSGTLLNPITTDLMGNVLVAGGAEWTGTDTTGHATAFPLGSGGSSTLGLPGRTDATWVDFGAFPSTDLLPAKTTASGRVTRRASSDPACFSHFGQGLARLSHDIG